MGKNRHIEGLGPIPGIESLGNDYTGKHLYIGDLEPIAGIESSRDYYRELYYFVHENISPVMTYKRNDLSENRFEFFTQTIYTGVVRTSTVKINSIHDCESKWIVESEACYFVIDHIPELILPALIAAEKARYTKFNLKLSMERKIFDNQMIEMIACRKNPEFNVFGYKLTFVKSDFDLDGYMWRSLKLPLSLYDEMKCMKNAHFNFSRRRLKYPSSVSEFDEMICMKKPDFNFYSYMLNQFLTVPIHLQDDIDLNEIN